MLDKTIPFYNLILRCDQYEPMVDVLPEGYSFRMYRSGNERAWATLEYEIGDFDSIDEAQEYFTDSYCKNSLLSVAERCVFVVNENDEIIASCIAWKDERNGVPVSSLHWLVVSEEYQGKGIGKALCAKVMEIFLSNDEMPVYIHTQPWSYKAVILYVRHGFRIQKSDSFSHYENQYADAMRTLKKILPEDRYEELIGNAE